MSNRMPSHLLVFLAALGTRLGGVIVTTVSTLNTYSLADADSFSAMAARTASSLLQDGLFLPEGGITELWGFFLSPFWLLPGPSRIYARVGMALLGALAVYNVFVVARHYHSETAAWIAVLPMLVYPSFLFIHSTVLREAAVLFGLTTTARLLVAPSPRIPTAARYGAALASLWFAFVLRTDNLPVYAAVLAIGVVVYYRRYLPSVTRLVAPLAVAAVGLLSIPRVQSEIASLADIRESRARDRTKYLPDIFPETITDAVAFSWIGAAYFLFTPFPWMIETVPDLVAFGEAMANVGFALAAIVGARELGRRSLPVATALVVGIVLGVILYGLATANVGTAVRHRQMVLWAIFLLGGIGIAEYADVRPVLAVRRLLSPAEGSE